MKEACIYKRPAFQILRWSAVKGARGRVCVEVKRKGGQLYLYHLEYFDSEQQVALCKDGTVLHLPPDLAQPDPISPCAYTEDLLALMRQPRWIRKPAVLVIADDCPDLRRLLSKVKQE